MVKKPKTLRYGDSALLAISHWRALKNSIKFLKQKPASFLLTAMTLAVIISLPIVLYSLLHEFQSLTKQFSSKPVISVYLKPYTATKNIQTLIRKTRAYPNVLQVNYISPEQGLKDFKRYSEFASAIPLLKSNPLPPVINITFSKLDLDKKPIDLLLNSLKKSPLVDQVSADIIWIQRLQYSLNMIKRFTLTLSLLLASAMVLVISNTVRLTAQAHHEETRILSLLGASRDYIRRPFLYHGLVYGCCGGVIALILSYLALSWIMPPLIKLIASYQQNRFSDHSSWSSGFFIVAMAILLSVIGSWLATRHFFTSNKACSGRQ